MANKTYEIAFKIAGQMSGNFTSTFRNAGSVVKGFSAGISGLNRQAANVGNVVKLRKETGQSARAYVQAKQEADRLAQALGNHGKPTQQMIADYNKAKTAVDKARAALEKKRATLKEAESAAGTNGKSLKELIARNDELTKSTERVKTAQEAQKRAMDALNKNNETLKATAGYAAASMAGISAGIMSAVKTGIEFEAQMSKVGAVSRASEEDLAKLTAQAKELGKSTVWSSSEAAQGMQYLAMAGFDTTEILKTMPGMLDLASAGAIDLGQAADISSNILTGFGLSAEDMGRVGDVLTNTFTSSNTSLEMLGNTMKYAAPVAKAMGVSIEEAAAMAGKLGDAGIQGEMAGTALRGIMLKLSAPTKAAANALADLGVKTTDAQGNMRSFPAILADIQKATEGMSEAQKAAYVKTIFETEAMSGAMILMEQAGTGALQKYAKSLTETGSATRVARQQNDNLSGDFKALSSAIEGTALLIYDSLQPTLRNLAQWATNVVNAVGKWAAENQGLVQTLTLAASGLGAVAAAAVPLVVAVKTAQFAWASFKAPILAVNAAIKTVRVGWALYKGTVAAGTAVTKGATIAQKAFQLAALAGAGVMKILRSAQLALNLAMSANPIGLVVTALAALVAAGVAVYQNWETIRAKIVELWTAFAEKFPAIAEVLRSWAEGVGQMIETVKGYFAGVMEYLGILWGGFTEKFPAIAALLHSWATSIGEIIENVKGVFTGIIDFITNVFTGSWSVAWESVKTIFSNVFGALEGIIKAPLNAIIDMVNSVIGGINEMGSVKLPSWAGGASFGISIPTIPRLADGGVATSPTLAMIGEGRESEAVLPLSKLGDMIGGGLSGGGSSVTVNMTVNVSGSSGDAYSDIKRGLSEGTRDLKRELERLLNNQRRLSFA